MATDSDIATGSEILDALKAHPNKSIMIRDTKCCEALVSKLGLVNQFPETDEAGFAAALFDHESHHVIVARWREHPDDEKLLYQAFCAAKTTTSMEEGVEILRWVKFLAIASRTRLR